MHGVEIKVLPTMLVLLCAAGGARIFAKSPAAPVSEAEQAVQLALKAAESAKQDYRISPQDVLFLSVYQEEDLKREAQVSQSGKINFPLVGEVEVGGLTVLEVETRLRQMLKVYLVEPHVSATIKSYHSRQVFVLGEVAKPGSYSMPSDRTLTVVEAIALAGGFTKIASPDKTRVVRKNEGQVENVTVPVKQITRGDKAKDVPLKPDDVVFVPQTFF